MKMMKFCFILLMSAVITDSSAVKVSVYPTEPNEGASVLLECLFHGDPADSQSSCSIEWTFMSEQSTKMTPVFLYYSSQSFPVNNKSRWVGDISQNNGSITLVDLQPSDSGKYTCEVRMNAQINKGQIIMKVIPRATVWTATDTDVGTEMSTTTGENSTNDGGNQLDWKYVVLVFGAALIGSVIGSATVCLRKARRADRNDNALKRHEKDVEKKLSDVSRSSQENVYTPLYPDKRKNSNVEEENMKKKQQENVYMNTDNSSTLCRDNKDPILEKQVMMTKNKGIKQQEETYMTMDNSSTVCRDKKEPNAEEQVRKIKKNKERKQQDDAYITMHPVREPTVKKNTLMDVNLYEKLDEVWVNQTGRKNNESEAMLPDGLAEEK